MVVWLAANAGAGRPAVVATRTEAVDPGLAEAFRELRDEVTGHLVQLGEPTPEAIDSAMDVSVEVYRRLGPTVRHVALKTAAMSVSADGDIRFDMTDVDALAIGLLRGSFREQRTQAGNLVMRSVGPDAIRKWLASRNGQSARVAADALRREVGYAADE